MPPLALTPHESKSITTYTEAAKAYVSASRSANTLAAYASAWQSFTSWAAAHEAQALPAAVPTVVAYLTAMAEGLLLNDDGHKFKLATIKLHRAALAFKHRTARQPDPTATEDVKLVLAGIARKLSETGKRALPAKKSPLTLADLRRVLAALPDGLAGTRDRALLLVGWAGAFRRSELVAIDVAQVRTNDDLKITVARSKTDQEGAGFVKVIPAMDDKALCPLTALRAWLDAAGIKSGVVFRQIDRWGNVRANGLTGQSVSLILKAAAEAVGIDPRQLAGHSLRSGFITAAAEAGVESRDIMAVSGHKSEAVMRGYIQDAGKGAKRAIKAAFGEQ